MIRRRGDGEPVLPEGVDDFVIVFIDDVRIVRGEGILIVPCAGGPIGHKQLARRADGALVAVGHVHEIVPAVVHAHQVPHVRARTAAAVHETRDQYAVVAAAEIRQIDQVLECLGIALADHFCAGIVVENPDQLPGIAVGRAASRRSIIVGDFPADGVLVSGNALEHVAGAARDDGLGFLDGRLGRGDPGGIDGQQVCVRRIGEVLRNQHIDNVASCA